MSSSLDSLHAHIVVPGQVIAASSSTSADDSFLRGHGTYIETTSSSNSASVAGGYSSGSVSGAVDGNNASQPQPQVLLRSAVVGTVQRVNKLISVEALSLHTYQAHVGDLIVGRVVSIVSSGSSPRWMVDISGDGGSILAQLPLSGVHLPGSVQRVKTATDALEMQRFINIGDLVSCEVHKLLSNSIVLHTRSVRYGKLENGTVVRVPPRLIPRLKAHYTTLFNERFAILLGCNGMIWLQRNNKMIDNQGLSNDDMNVDMTGTAQASQDDTAAATSTARQGMVQNPNELAELEEERRVRHAETPYTLNDRQCLARLRNVIVCLRQTLTEITPTRMEAVYHDAVNHTAIMTQSSTTATSSNDAATSSSIANMLIPENVVQLTASCRQ